MRVSEPTVVGPGQRSEPFELEKHVRVNVTKKDEATNVIVYDAMLCVSRKDPLEMAGLARSNALYFAALRECLHDRMSNPSTSSFPFPVSCRSVFPGSVCYI